MATSKIGEFDVAHSERWETYEERMEQFLVVNSVEEETLKRARLITAIGDDCYQLLRNLLSPRKPKDVSFDDMIKALRNHFNPKPKIVVERFNFHSRTQHEGESVSDFLASLRKLAATCGFGQFLDEALRDRFVVGLRNQLIQQRLLQEDNLTLPNALTTATAMEAAEKGVVTISATGSTHSAMAAKKTAKHQTNEKSLKSSSQSGCFRCGARDHWARSCPHRNKSCEKCGRFGHHQDACRTKEGARELKQGKSSKRLGSARSRQGRKVHYTHQNVRSHSSDSSRSMDYNSERDTGQSEIITVNTT